MNLSGRSIAQVQQGKAPFRLLSKLLGAMAVSSILSGCSSTQYPLSDHYDGEKFYNPSGKKPRGFGDLLKWWREDKASWPKWVDIEPPAPLEKPVPEGEIHITFINHATFLVRTNEWSLLTDPHFTQRASPFSFMGPKRVHRPGIELESIENLHYVFISHNHYDHLDLPTLRKLKKRFLDAKYIVPLGNERLLKSQGIEPAVALDWWQSLSGSDQLKMTLVPAEHWSARGLLDRNENLWGGLILQWKQRTIFFAGDTGYGQQFKEIKNRFGKIDLALLPIGAYEPRWFMAGHHMNPEDAVKAHLDIQPELSVGMHFGCFQLTNESRQQPGIDLEKAKLKYKVQDNHFLLPEPGQTIILK